MRSSNFGYVLLLGVVFAAPACKVETHITGGEACSGAGTGGGSGMSGDAGKSGSAGHGGSGGSAGSVETGGASGAAEGGAAGATDAGGAAGSDSAGAESGGSSGAGGSSDTCDTSGFQFPEVTCDTGAVSELTNPTCQDVLLCLGLADCATSHMDCAVCLDYLKGAFESTDTCIQSGTPTSLTEACTKLAHDNAAQYPQCVPK